MRKPVIFLLFSILLLTPYASAMAQDMIGGQIELNDAIVDQISTVLDADNVLGNPVIVGGQTVIPVVCMTFGFGSARGAMEMHSGSGGGGLGMVMPMSMLVISKEGDISVVEARKNQLVEMIKGLVLAYMGMMHDSPEAVEDGAQ